MRVASRATASKSSARTVPRRSASHASRFVVWLFLRDVRATLISSAALPLSLVPTFGAMYLLSESLNSITLLGIALVVDLLVDDAIVEIENVVRCAHQSGKNAYEAATFNEHGDQVRFSSFFDQSVTASVCFASSFRPRWASASGMRRG